MLVNEKEMIIHKKYEELSGYNFRIPLYQRKYAWSEDEVNALLEDLLSNKSSDYYIGNIVVEQREDKVLDVIDGQQRLTTLYLISKIATGEDTFELHYEIRKEDNDFLKDFENEDKKLIADIQFRQNIKTILKFQETILKPKRETLNNLLAKCKIALTILPKDVDIVKYFEVMNNRGKQLEKHQILKAKLLRMISNDKCESDDIDYGRIWDYCSNMNVYIEDSILYGILKNDEKKMENSRKAIFKFLYKESEQKQELLNIFKFNNSSNLTKEEKNININNLTIREIINGKENISYKEEFYVPQEYSSIVKFPIFIMQTFKIYASCKEPNLKDINNLVINDGYLINYFNNEKNEFIFDNGEKSKNFILFLLRMRILYDYFIFKRDEKDKPYLDLIIKENNEITFSEDQNSQKQILMLQLLLNFSAPNYFAQDWLAVALKWLNNEDINEKLVNKRIYEEFLSLLKELDRDMALERLSKAKDLTGLINSYFLNTKKVNNFDEKDFVENAQLNSGTSTPHYWFYKLDYLLWKDSDIWKDLKSKFTDENKFKYELINKDFRLSRLNSIEHIYPQSKKEDWELGKIDNFGNLTLISNHMNSALIDKDNVNKKLKIQEQLNNGTIESLKMILAYSKYKDWTPENCDDHQEKMINILIEDLKSC